MAWITILGPIVLELLKILFGGSSSADARAKAASDILDKIREINAALKKAEETEGDTSNLEKIINRPKK